MAQQATLINSAGKKVVVDTGSQQAKDYFAQGYSLMGSTAASKPAAPTAGYSSSDPAVQKQLADMQKQVQALSSKASSSYSSPSAPSSLSVPSAPASTQSQASPQGQTSLASSGNSNVPAGLVKVDGVSRGAGGSSSVNAYTQDPNFDEKYEDMQWIGNDLYARKIPLATLISPTGQRVVARTDSVSSGKYKPAADYFAQGYVLEKTPGVYTDSSGKSTAFGAQVMEPAKAKAYDASKTQPVASSSGPGAGFSLPSGYTAISGALYPDRASQLANFSDIRMYGREGESGSFLYGKPKNPQQGASGSQGQQGPQGSASQAPTPAAPDLPFGVLSFLQQNVVSPEDAAKALQYYSPDSSKEDAAKALQYYSPDSSKEDAAKALQYYSPDSSKEDAAKALQYYSPDSSNADKAAALERLYGESRKAILDRQSQLKALEDEILKSMVASPDEIEAQKLLDEIVAQQRNISSSEELGINEIKKQPIAMAFLSGQSAAVQRDAASKINALASQSEPLKAQLAQAQAKRQAASDVAKARYDIAQKQYSQFLEQTKPMEVGGNIVRFNPITQEFEVVYEGAEDSKPVSVSPGATLVDPRTGKIIYQAPSSGPSISPQAILQRASDIKAQKWAEGQVNFTDQQAIQQAYNEFTSISSLGSMGVGFGGPGGASATGGGSVPGAQVDNYVAYGPGNGVPSGEGGMRTDRSNNPTALIVDIARQAGLKEGTDYTVGDPFTSNGKTYYTAKLIGDPVAQTIRIIDKVGFQTASGSPRWSYINIPKAEWDAMGTAQKAAVVHQMYQREGNGGALEPYFAKYGIGQAGANAPSQAAQAPQPGQPQGSQGPSYPTGNKIVDSYVQDVYQKKMSIKDVPDNYRSSVTAILSSMPPVGNALFNNITQQDRDSVNDILNMVPKIAKLTELMGKVNTGPLSDLQNRAAAFTNFFPNEDKLMLRNIVEDLRAAFQRRISGATVSDREVARLANFLPTFSQDDTKFDVNANQLAKNMETSLANIAMMFGFPDTKSFVDAFQGRINMPGNAGNGTDIESLRAKYQY